MKVGHVIILIFVNKQEKEKNIVAKKIAPSNTATESLKFLLTPTAGMFQSTVHAAP